MRITLTPVWAVLTKTVFEENVYDGDGVFRLAFPPQGLRSFTLFRK